MVYLQFEVYGCYQVYQDPNFWRRVPCPNRL